MTGSSSTGSAPRQRKGPHPDSRKPDVPQPSTGLKPRPPPTEKPSFSVADVRNAVPKHCFERSALRSTSHLLVDLAISAALFYAATFISHESIPVGLKLVLWPLYWYVQGMVLTGVWVLAHECGHQAFSSHKWYNDLVGWICHSALLVPYHSWRISHANHHKYTCHMDHDEVFVPSVRSAFKGAIEESPFMSMLMVFNMLVFGWPGYLIANFSGPQKYKDTSHSHFNPRSALYKTFQYFDIIWSDIGLFLALSALGYLAYTFGTLNVLFYYFVPYLVVNAHLVMITFLQHTDTYIPHWREEEFSWLRGAMSTVDRSYGWLHDIAFHHIADTHVAHHLFHTMPWYHAEEATEAIKKVLGPYYLKDDTNALKALWRSWRDCRCVEDSGDILFYKRA